VPIRTKLTKFSKQPEPLIRTEILSHSVARSAIRTYVSRGEAVQHQSLWSSHVQLSRSTPAVLFFFSECLSALVFVFVCFFIKSVLRPLQVDNYGIIVTLAGVMVGRGKFLLSYEHVNAEHNYSHCTLLQNGKHSSVSKSSNISTISYLAVQVFEHMYARQFCSVPAATAIFQTHQYSLLSSINFLTLLDYNLKEPSTTGHYSRALAQRLESIPHPTKSWQATASSAEALTEARQKLWWQILN